MVCLVFIQIEIDHSIRKIHPDEKLSHAVSDPGQHYLHISPIKPYVNVINYALNAHMCRIVFIIGQKSCLLIFEKVLLR